MSTRRRAYAPARDRATLTYQLFPRSIPLDDGLKPIVEIFDRHHEAFRSDRHNLDSDGVLAVVRSDLLAAGFQVETGKEASQKIPVPVLFRHNGEIDQSSNADAVSQDGRIVLENEAGRAVSNHQFLKDVFQASMMYGVEYLAVAVRLDYRGANDFEKVYRFLETLYINGRIRLPLTGILLIGY